MISVLVLAGLLLGAQGNAVVVSVDDEPGLAEVTLQWAGRELALAPAPCDESPASADARCWLALIGVDLDAEPGTMDVPIRLRFAGGRTVERQLTLTIEAREFPTTRLTVEPGYVDLSSADQARAAREAVEIAEIYATVTPARLWAGDFQIPVQGVTGGRNFGHRRIFNGQPRSPHSGADLRAATGTAIAAANRGRVVLAKPLFFSGNAVFLDHGMGVYSVYLHLSEIRVEVGDLVEKGEVVGLAGATGRVTGPHLHWGARILEARVDPFSLAGIGPD